MLGLSSGLVFNNYPIGISQPSDVSNLLGWWDFTDANTMYTDAGSTNVSSDGDKIYRIDNKAYAQAGDEAIGQFLQQATEDYRPLFKTSGGTNSKNYAWYYSADGNETMYLSAHATLGNTVSGKLSTTSFDNDKWTMFCVHHPQPTAEIRAIIFEMYGHDYDAGTGIFEKFNTRARHRFEITTSDTDGDGDIDTSDEHRPRVALQRGNSNGSTAPTTRFWDSVGSSIGIESTPKFRYDTIIVNGQTATTSSAPYLRSGRLLKNGDDSNGINSSFKTSVSNSDDDSDTSLNLGVDGLMSPSAVQIGAHLSMNDVVNVIWIAPIQDFLRQTKVYEVIYYNKVLNQEEITGVQNYIESKYGEPPY